VTFVDFAVGADEAGQRLDQFLAGKDVPYSRSQLKRLIDDGNVTVNGAPGKAGRKLKTGDVVVFAPPPPVAASLAPEDIPLRVLFEDEYLIVVDKPAGMVVHPAAGNPSGTLVNALLHHCKDLAGIGGELRPGIVHRLDKDTTGAMVATKDDVTHTAVGALFKKRDLTRLYQAVVSPAPPADSGTIKTMYGRHPVHRKLFTGKIAVGKKAVTHWRVLRRFGDAAALVECKLETGRTHQIRVHMSEAGWPLVGDKVYGKPPKDARVRALAERLGRQALHAEVLRFVHPRTGAVVDTKAEVPDDMRALLEGLEGLT
jgi:23S rRNA pseudouridine1911/1915/1917 synthase